MADVRSQLGTRQPPAVRGGRRFLPAREASHVAEALRWTQHLPCLFRIRPLQRLSHSFTLQQWFSALSVHQRDLRASRNTDCGARRPEFLIR